MSFRVVIPARYASTRLPGKPMLEIAGKPMIQHVCERALASGAAEVAVATDDRRIAAAVEHLGVRACLTAATHQSGTDRLAEAVQTLGYENDEIVVNVQGDEPLIPVALIDQVAADLDAHPAAGMATLCHHIDSPRDLFDPHVVKVVRSQDDYALYFSRATVPWDRDAFSLSTEVLPSRAQHFRHIGLYAYRVRFVKAFVDWPRVPLEEMESLEQLRALWHGARIHVAEAVEPPAGGVDTEEDLARVRQVLSRER